MELSMWSWEPGAPAAPSRKRPSVEDRLRAVLASAERELTRDSVPA